MHFPNVLKGTVTIGVLLTILLGGGSAVAAPATTELDAAVGRSLPSISLADPRGSVDIRADLSVPYGAEFSETTGMTVVVPPLSPLAVGGTLTAELVGTATGEAPDDRFSNRLWSVGDLNNDGYSDWAAQVPPKDVTTASPVDGKVYVFFGGSPLDLSADVILTAPVSGKAFAWEASGVGDVTGDSIDDLVVTEYRDGGAYVYFGGDGAFDNAPDLTLDDGTNEWDTTVCSAGDVNGDGHMDIAMGVGHDDSCGFDRGKVHVFYGGPLLDGTPDEDMCSADGGDIFGVSLHGGADLNDDGDEDLVVGAWDARSGSVHLYWGGDAWDTTRALRLDEAGQFYGTSGQMLSHGDVNGDSVDDLLVGQNWTGGVDVFLYYGGTSMDSTKDASWVGYGSAVAGTSDVNGDSFDEVVIGNLDADTVSLFFGGAPPSATPALQLTGDATGERYGQAVAIGDFDGDGWQELLVGAPRSDDAGTEAGKVYLYRLTTGPYTGTIYEEFDSADGFTSTDPDVYIQDGKVHWHVSRGEGEQYVYRSIPSFTGAVRLTVTGQVDGATNNCGVSAGIGDGYRSGIGVSYGFYGGGCSTQGYVIRAGGADLDYSESHCVFTGNWLWINSGTQYTATLTLEGDEAELSVPGIGSSSGTPTYDGVYNTLYVGTTGGGDWPSCWGTIERMVIEQINETTKNDVHLPAVMNNYIPVLWEAEPNGHGEDVGQANGPLVSGKTYRGYPNDQDDYYYFELLSQTRVSVVVEQFAPTSSNGTVSLYGPAVGDRRGELIDYYGEPGDASMALGPHSLGPGKYYIRVYTAGNHSTTQAYRLTVTY